MKKVALITGATSGFGFGVAENLLDRGYIVYATGRRVEKLKELEDRGAKTRFLDVTDEESIDRVISEMIEVEGQIDLLLNNAGYGSYGTIEDIPLEEVMRQYDINVFGMARVLKKVLPHMRKRRSGRIVITASLVSHITTPGLGWYASTKHALKAMTDTLRAEVKHLGIDVVLIKPGAVKTEFESVALAALERVKTSDEYKTLIDGFTNFTKDMYRDAPDAKSTIAAMVEACVSEKPRAVYYTTKDAKILPILRKFLPERLYDSIVLKQIMKKTN